MKDSPSSIYGSPPCFCSRRRFPTPDQHVIFAVNNICPMALGLNSWGLTVKILAQPLHMRGTRLVPPRILLQWQHGQAFVKFFKSPHTFHGVISNAYHEWATPLGICTSLVNLHLYQLGTVKLTSFLCHAPSSPVTTLPFIGVSALSFSRTRRGAVFETRRNLPLAVPLWHNVLFCNRDGSTCYNPELVRKGVLTTARISEGSEGEESLIQSLLMLTKTVYRSAFKRIHHSEGACFAPYQLPEFWQSWSKRTMAWHLTTPCVLKPIRLASVWKQFNKVSGPTHFTEFLRRALWAKLPVGSRLIPWRGGQGHCQFHGVVEDHNHALRGCLYHKVIESFVSTAFPGPSVDVILEGEQSLATQRGLFTGIGAYAHWQLRGSRKQGSPVQAPQPQPPPNIQQFLHTWAAGLNEWPLVQRTSVPRHLIKAFVQGILTFSTQGSFRFSTPPTQEGTQGNKRKSAFSSGLKHN